MKSCAYCGKDNEEGATVCIECGTEFSSLSGNADLTKWQTRRREILDDPVRLFRALVVVSTVTYVIWYLQFPLVERLLSEETRDLLAWHGYGALIWMPTGVAWLIFFLSIVVAVGLWTFSKSARFVFASLIGFFAVWSLLTGLRVETAFGSFLVLIMNMADGAILVIAYTTPLKERFE